MSGIPGKSGGARRGAGRTPVIKFRNKQAVRVAGLWGGERESAWRDATIGTARIDPRRMQIHIADGDNVIHIIVVISPISKSQSGRPAVMRIRR